MVSRHADKAAIASPEWVKEEVDRFHSDDPAYRLVEVDMDPAAYDGEHVPGAVGIDWEADFAGELGSDLVDRTEFEDLLGSFGISNDTTVVLYGDEANWFAAHAYWVFKYYGHDDVRLMDGGRHYWLWEGNPTTTDVPSFTPREYGAGEPDESIRAYRDEVMDALEAEGTIIDVRNPREYRGESPPADIPATTDREGHIPGARNVPWGEAINADGTFKPEAELRELYAGGDDEDAITYCRIGECSSLTWFVMHELLDMDAANYDGSWSEWADQDDAPIETPRRKDATVPGGD